MAPLAELRAQSNNPPMTEDNDPDSTRLTRVGRRVRDWLDGDAPDSIRSIRIRKHVHSWFVVIVVALLVSGAIGAALVYEPHVDPGVETEEEAVVTWQESTNHTHQAEVRSANPVFDVGQVLSDRPAYFTTPAPELEGTHEYTYTARDDGALDVELLASLRIRAVDGDGHTHWELTEELNADRHEALAPDETATVDFSLNVTEVLVEIDRVEDGLGAGVGTVETDLVFTTVVSGTVNGENVQRTHQDRLGIDPGQSVYEVESDGGVHETHEVVSTTERELTYGPLRSYGPFGLVALSVVGLAGLLTLRRSGRLAPSQAELAALQRHQARQTFDDWISPGRIPEEMLAEPWVTLDSLEDLVDVAVDANQRVLEDTNRGTFFVIEDDRCYTDAESARRMDALKNGGSSRDTAAVIDGDSAFDSDLDDADENGAPEATDTASENVPPDE